MITKTKITVLLSMLALTFSITGQNLQWARAIGDTLQDNPMAIAIDLQGNVYTTGYFEGTVDFDPGVGTYTLSSTGGGDIFVSKLDAAGNFVWAVNMGGTSYDYGHGIVTDANGNVYITGEFQLTADFDPGLGVFNLTAATNSDIFTCKLDNAGNFVWANSFSGGWYDVGRTIALDPAGNIIIAGEFGSTVDFDPGTGTANLTAAGGTDIFVCRLSTAGNFQWAEKMGGTGYEQANAVATDAAGNIVTTGIFEQTVDFDPGTGTSNITATGFNDVFVCKLNSAGNFKWANKFGSTGMDGCSSIATDANGNVLTTGFFGWTTDFDPGIGTYTFTPAGGWDDGFISKLDSSGNFVWAVQIGSTNTDQGVSIATDPAGNVYALGVFMYTVDFDPGPGTSDLYASGSDIYVLKLDAGGNYMAAVSFGSTSGEWPVGIKADGNDNIYLTGNFQGTLDLDPGVATVNLTSQGQQDCFVSKLHYCALNLGVTQNGIVLSANTGGAAYQWIDCGTGQPLSGETAQTFTATMNGSYAVIITDNGCQDTSACYTINSVSVSLLSNGGLPATLVPNPFNSTARLSFGLSINEGQLVIYDILGNKVRTYRHIYGDHSTIERDGLPTGMYFYELKSKEGIRATGKMQIVD